MCMIMTQSSIHCHGVHRQPLSEASHVPERGTLAKACEEVDYEKGDGAK